MRVSPLLDTAYHIVHARIVPRAIACVTHRVDDRDGENRRAFSYMTARAGRPRRLGLSSLLSVVVSGERPPTTRPMNDETLAIGLFDVAIRKRTSLTDRY